MKPLTEVLGQPAIVADLLKKLAEPGARVWLQGASGSGKTTIADFIIAEVQKSRPVLRLAGDAANRGTKFLALHRALAGTRRPKSVRDAIKASVTSPLRAIPFVGGTAAEFAKIAVAAQSDVHPEFLTSEQQDLLAGMQRVAGNQPLLLVVDDIGWLDNDTAQLIANLRLAEVQTAYAFASRVTVLFVENLDEKPTLETSLLERLGSPDLVRISPVSREDFLHALQALGLSTPIEPKVLATLHQLAGGHLEFAKQIVQSINRNEFDKALEENDFVSLMSSLLSRRFSRGEREANIGRLLNIASCIGTSFLEAEARCAFRDEAAFKSALDAAIGEELFQSRGVSLEFNNEIIRAAVEQLSSSQAQAQAQDMHRKLVECIKLLRPGDYAARLRHAQRSGDQDLADELAFAVSMQAVRGERSPLVLDLSPEVQRVLLVLKEAYQLMDAGRHEQSMQLAIAHYHGEYGLVQGELVALISLNQIKRRTEDSYRAAAVLLEHWQHWSDEPELRQRLMSILMAAWYACGEEEKATSLYTSMASELMRRSISDPNARTRAESLNRKADQFFSSEIALKHIQRAVDWFAPPENTDSPRNAFEYTSSLVNLAGAQFTLGQFSHAAQSASHAMRWIDTLHGKGMRATEPYKALNNYVISAYRAGLESAGAAADALQFLLSEGDASWKLDRSLLAINAGALQLLAGKTDVSRALLEQVWGHIDEEQLDDYYTYYAASNLAAARLLTGERDGALELSTKLVSRSMPRWYRHAYGRRAELMIKAFEDPAMQTALSLDEYLLRFRQPKGNQDPWWTIGRGLLLSDIQVWSE